MLLSSSLTLLLFLLLVTAMVVMSMEVNIEVEVEKVAITIFRIILFFMIILGLRHLIISLESLVTSKEVVLLLLGGGAIVMIVMIVVVISGIMVMMIGMEGSGMVVDLMAGRRTTKVKAITKGETAATITGTTNDLLSLSPRRSTNLTRTASSLVPIVIVSASLGGLRAIDMMTVILGGSTITTDMMAARGMISTVKREATNLTSLINCIITSAKLLPSRIIRTTTSMVASRSGTLFLRRLVV